MRIYCALTRSELELLSNQGGIEIDALSSLTIYAQTQQWIDAQDESDPDVLDDEILHQAAGEQPGYLVVAEIPAGQATVVSPVEGLVQLSAPIRLKDVAAYFVVDQDGELSWFGPSELPVLLDSGK